MAESPRDRYCRKNWQSFADVLLQRTTLVGFVSSWKIHTVECCFVLGSYEYVHDYELFLMQLKRIFPTFSRINQHEPSFERLSRYAVFNENKPFFHTDIHAKYYWCFSFWCLKMPQSHDMSHEDYALLAHAKHRCFLEQQPKLTLRGLSWGERKTRLNSCISY